MRSGGTRASGEDKGGLVSRVRERGGGHKIECNCGEGFVRVAEIKEKYAVEGEVRGG